MDTPVPPRAGQTESGANDSTVAPVGGSRGFWVIFAAAWLGYLGLMIVAAFVEGEPVTTAPPLTVAPAALATIVAWRRWDLVNPDRSLVKTGGILLVAALAYSCLSAALTLLVISWLDLSWGGVTDVGPAVLFAKLVVQAMMLFFLLAAFLMWTVSAERIQQTRALAAREAVLRAQAEANALRAQFNPHFVFNTLHSLMLLVREEPDTAERAIENVASLIRYASSLERRGQDVVPLSQEIEIAEKYLALESLRLEDRLDVEWKIESGLGTMEVPAFALQTLLENAIKHGVSPKPEGGRIVIQVAAHDKGMVLKVQDDGMGADSADINESDGSGLKLLEQRISVLYGDTATLEWHTEPRKGFSVTVRWPKTPEGEGKEARSK